MPRFTRIQVHQAMYDTGLVPIFFHKDVDVAINIARACYEGGARLIEFTNRGDFAIETFTALEKACAAEMPELITGAGSIVDAGTAAMYASAGANFIVGPNLKEDVARFCNRRKLAYSPGCATATEISAAEELGVEIVKLFPGDSAGGPSFVKSLLGPCPWTSLMPTGGVDVTEESLQTWFAAGVACVGIGSKLIPAKLVEASNYSGISASVRRALDTISRVRKP